MSNDAIRQTVLDTVSRLVPTATVTADASLTNLGITSLKFIRLVIALEKNCKVLFDDQHIDLSVFQSVGHLITYIDDKKSAVPQPHCEP